MTRSRIQPVLTWRGAIMDSDLAATTRYVALALSLYMGDRGDSAHPGPTRLSKDMAVSLRTVKEHLGILVDQGWLVIVEKGGCRGERRRANDYRAAVPPTRAADAPVQQMHGAADAPVQEVPPTRAANDSAPVQQMHPNSSLDLSRGTLHTEGDAQGASHAHFDDFWAVYPRKVDKIRAQKAWESAIKKSAPPDLVSAASRYAESRADEDPKFTVHPATWLNGERWDDEPPPRKEDPNMAVLRRSLERNNVT